MDSADEHPTVSTEAAIIRLNRHGIIESLSRQAEKMTGIAASAAVGLDAESVFRSRKELADLFALCQPIHEGQIILSHTVRIRDSSGKQSSSFSASVLPIPGKDQQHEGTIICFDNSPSGSSTDLNILNSVADGVFTVDKNWKVTSFNRAAEAITGWSAREAIGKSCSDVFHSSICGRSCAIAESLYSGRPISNRSLTIKRHDGEKIPVSISTAPLIDHEGNIIGGVETFRDLSALTTLRKQLSKKYSFNEIVSKSKAMQRLFAILPEVAASPSTVLIYGESGTGKELMARSIYDLSDRRDGPFVAVNCGALPETLLESELFGYKAGAFTDARKDKEGRFAAAEGGTLFLDEIGDIPGSLQVKLLRVLQEKVYEPLGSNTSVETDVRIITATNKDLQKLVMEEKFREDLYYRLNVVRIHLPPLRERKKDIPKLVDQFIEEFCSQQGKDIVGVASPTLNIFMRHDFPGNVRELKNIIEYAFILCDGGYILPEHLPEPFNTGMAGDEPGRIIEEDRPQTLEEIEKQAIYLALEKNKWKKGITCEELGISKDTLRRKLIKYNLEGTESG